MDNNTVAALYSPWQEGDDNSTTETPNEIHLYHLEGQAWNGSEKIQTTDYRKLDSELIYSSEHKLFIAFTLHEAGFTVIDMEGRTLFSNPSLIIDACNVRSNYC